VLKDLQKKHGKKAAFLAEFETTSEAWEVLDDYYRNGVPFHDCTNMTEEQRKRFIIADNVDFGEWDADALGDWDSGDLETWGVDIFEGNSENIDAHPADNDAAYASLQERFICPPFSVLDAKQGYWQERKRAWLALGIESELGRGGV
jgi:hypothetical protein